MERIKIYNKKKNHGISQDKILRRNQSKLKDLSMNNLVETYFRITTGTLFFYIK